MFPFPSNGKVYPKRNRSRCSARTENIVSIPFKRESLSKVTAIEERMENHKFPFPSNGKVYPKGEQSFCNRQAAGFPFPSNGKVYPKKGINIFDEKPVSEFQFPSNGKVYPKQSRLERGLFSV